MEGLSAWVEETLNAKLHPLEKELEAQQQALIELVSAVTSLTQAKPASARGKPTLDLPKSRLSDRPLSGKKGDEEQKATKPVSHLPRTSSSGGLKSDRNKKSPFQEADESDQNMRKSLSSAKLPTTAIKKPVRHSASSTKDLSKESKNPDPETIVSNIQPAEESKIVEVKPSFDTELEELLKTNRLADLETKPEFVVSAGVRGALTLINTLSESDLFLDTEPPKETTNVMRVFYQLLGKSLPDDDTEAWTILKEFLAEAKSNSLEEEILRMAQEQFDFSDANIEALDAVHSKVKDTLASQSSQLAEYMMYLVLEALNYAGICSNPAPWRQYSRLKYKQAQAK